MNHIKKWTEFPHKDTFLLCGLTGLLLGVAGAVTGAQMEDGQDYPPATSTPGTGRSPWIMANNGAATGSTSYIGIYSNSLNATTTPALAGLTNSLNPEAHLQIARAGSSARLYYRSIGSPLTNGAVYFSFLLNVPVSPTTNDEILCELIPAVPGGSYPVNPSTNDALTLHARKGATASQFNLGIQSLGGAVSWAASTLTTNSNYLVVMQYTFGAGQPCRLFVNPTPGAAQPAPNASATKGAAAEPNGIGTVLFWESATDTTGTYKYDVMRADASWANVTPAANLPTLRVLFLGNSLLGISSQYANDIPAHLANLTANLGDSFAYTSVANGGWELLDHATNAPSTNAINSGSYDLVVLQEQSDNPSQPSVRSSRMFPACRTLNTLITNHAQRTLFYESWGYLNGDTAGRCNGYDIPAPYKTCDGGFGSFSAMNIATRQGYALIADELGATISPVGLAWARVRTENPGLNLYILDDSLADRHPNSYGAYLAACVFYSTFFGRSPEGSTYYSTNNVSDAQYLQRVAAETVLDNPFAGDVYGFGPNRYPWAFNWQNYTNPASAPPDTMLISGAGATPSPAVKVDSNVGSVGNVLLGTLGSSSTPGQGRMYLSSGGGLVITGAMTVGREGKGFVRQTGGALTVNGALTLGAQPGSHGQYILSNGLLRAAQILNGSGSAEFRSRGGSLSFGQFGSEARPLNLFNEAGTVLLTNSNGPSYLFGNFTNSGSATMAIELGGASDVLRVSGSALLAGTLSLDYAPGFTPAPGQQFCLLAAASVSGSFANVIRPPVGADGLGLVPSITATSVVATVANFAARLESPIVLTNGNLRFEVTGISGSEYVLQTSTNLANWIPLQTNTAPFTFIATNTPSDRQRFYRAVYQP